MNIRDKPGQPTVARARDAVEPAATPRGANKPIARAFDPAEPAVAPAPTRQIGRLTLPFRSYRGGFSLTPLNLRRWR